MNLPNIGLKSPYDFETFNKWVEEHDSYPIVDNRHVITAFAPAPKNEDCSGLVLQVLKQITDINYYNSITLISAIKENELGIKEGIYFPSEDKLDFEFGSINTKIPSSIKLELQSYESFIKYDAHRLYNKSDILKFLPFVYKKFNEKIDSLPIIPIIYKKCKQNDLNNIFKVLFRNRSLIIVIGQLSHSLSQQEVKSSDSSTISQIIALDDSVDSSQSNVYRALNGIIRLSDIHFLQPKLLTYQISGNNLKFINTSGYASIVFYD